MRSYSMAKSGKRIPRRIIYVALALIVLLVAAAAAVRHEYNENLKAVSTSQEVHYLTINQGASVKDIAAELKDAGVIRSASVFEWYVSANNDRNKLQAGTYGLTPSQSTPAIVAMLVGGKVATNLVTIVPGQRLDQVRQDFIKAGFKPDAVDAALVASQYRADYPALSDSPASASLEGFLYPDSYQKTASTDPSQIVTEALTEMQQHLTPQLRAAFAAEGLTTYQGVTLASIVEQEVAKPSDRAQVAQVFLKRLSIGMPLGSDVTAFYGSYLAGQAPSTSYDSPFNTLLHKGLPPGPIGAVSDSSLAAVAHPANTNWLYFVSGDDGTTHFSQTLQQHQALTQQFCHKLCNQSH